MLCGLKSTGPPLHCSPRPSHDSDRFFARFLLHTGCVVVVAAEQCMAFLLLFMPVFLSVVHTEVNAVYQTNGCESPEHASLPCDEEDAIVPQYTFLIQNTHCRCINKSSDPSSIACRC